jgi:cytoskeletal protein CcmA (bactofilin family)
MFEKKPATSNDQPDQTDVFRPAKGSSKVIIGNGVKLKGEIIDADEVQIDGTADVTMSADNLIVGGTGNLKGTIQADNADVWGNIDGDLKISGTLTIQEQGSVSGSVEYHNLQIKLGGKIIGDVKVSDKVIKITDAPTLDSASSVQDSVKEEKS